MLKKYELNTNLVPFFSGTYGSLWEITEYDEEGQNEVDVEYDFKDFMKSIVNSYDSQKDQILRDLKYDVDFITDIKFPGSFRSPQYYNFSTDVIDFTLTINKTKLKKALKKLESDLNFHTFLKDNYTSYDGFMSFTPNDFTGIKHEIENDGQESEQAIGAIIQYLTSKNNILNDIEEYVLEEWNCNGYGGLNYTIVNEVENE